MKLDEIREKIAEKISNDIDVWNDVINNTNPGNYGCDYWEAEVDYNDIWVDIPKKEFIVNSGNFSADLTLGGSRGDSSFDFNYSKPFAAKGRFEFTENNDVEISDVTIEIDTDVFGD